MNNPYYTAKKISVFNLIFSFFVPSLVLQASKTLFNSNKKQFLDNIVSDYIPAIEMVAIKLDLNLHIQFGTTLK